MTKQVTNELILAWRAAGPVSWCESQYGWITEEGTPIKLDPWQRAALGAWWEYKDSCSTFAISNVKKTGKTLTNAVLTAWRWLALPGVHFAVGNDLDQAASRVFSEVVDMVKRNPFLMANCRIQSKEIIFIPTSSTLTALAVDATGNAGANHTTASHTEAWGIFHEGSIRSYEELTPPPAKKHGLPPMRIVDSYAGFLGESKTWHDLVDRGLRGLRVNEQWGIYKAEGLILFHMAGEEARERCFRGTPEEAEAYYTEQARSLRANTWERFHNNQRTAGESGFVTPEQWEACYAADLRPLQPGDKRRVILGADASTSHDLTALVGCVYNDKTKLTEVVYCHTWKPVKIAGIRFGKATVDLQETIGAEVLRLHKAGQVAAVVADPYQLMTSIIEWQKAGIKVIELAQNAGRVESDTALFTAITSRSIAHYNDHELNEHMVHAVGVETPRGIRLAKERSALKIDAAVALSMATWGALDRRNRYAPVQIYDCNLGGIYHDENWNQRPHPEGITWHNCRHRNRGCYACEEELRPTVEQDMVYWQNHIPMTQEDRIRNSAPMGPEIPEPSTEAFRIFGLQVAANLEKRKKENG